MKNNREGGKTKKSIDHFTLHIRFIIFYTFLSLKQTISNQLSTEWLKIYKIPELARPDKPTQPTYVLFRPSLCEVDQLNQNHVRFVSELLPTY